MSESSVKFHRVEDCVDDDNHIRYEKSIICSFKTERFGYLQLQYDEKNGVVELPNEPDLEMLRKQDRKYVENAVAIAWRMIFDAPAATDRFQ